MSAEANKNVQIAANHLSLEDLELSQQRAQDEENLRSRRSVQVDITAKKRSVDSRLKTNIDSLNPERDSHANAPIEAESNSDHFEDLIVVSIPAIDDSNALEMIHSDFGLASRLQRVPPKVHVVPFVDERQSTVEEPKTPKQAQVEPSEVQTREPTVVELKVADQSASRADISETPEDWMPNRDKGEKRSNKQAKLLDTPKQAFNELANKVLADFPLGPSSVLLVADVDGKSSGDAVAYQLAHRLAERKIGKVLVVDSHFEERELTNRLALGSEFGMADILATGKTLEETICETNLANLDVLPVGTERMCMRRSSDSTWIAENIRSLRDEYQFVIVFVGNVFHRSTTMWAQHCDASYMAIEVGASNQTVAKSGVVRLQQFGARLMGCVVTDAAA